MAGRGFPTWRTVFRRIHLWIGVGTAALIVPIALSGTVLIFSDEIDNAPHPALYATSGPDMGQPADDYIAHAEAAVENATAALRVPTDIGAAESRVLQEDQSLEPAALMSVGTLMRWPAEAGRPVTVLVRLEPARPAGTRPQHPGGRDAARLGPGGPSPSLLVYLDPPTAAVLGVTDFRNTLTGQIHQFHENLMLPLYSGRQVVGWAGIALLLLCITGLVIWWPRNARLARALAWRRGPTTSINLHHAIGFWIAVPLGVMALTGIVLAFPPQAGAVLNLLGPPRDPPARPGFGPVLTRPALTAQRALEAGLAAADGARPRLLARPALQTGAWRLQVTAPDGTPGAVSVDDATARTTRDPPQRGGDAIGAFLRRIHEGHHHGPVWKAIAVLCGLVPGLLAVTGVLMWLRKRRNWARLTMEDA